MLDGPGGPLLVWQSMWVDGRYLSSNVQGKLRQAQGKLWFRGDDGALVALAVPVVDGEESARATLRAFMAQHFVALDAALNATKGP